MEGKEFPAAISPDIGRCLVAHSAGIANVDVDAALTTERTSGYPNPA